jgi:hypothetical protein
LCQVDSLHAYQTAPWQFSIDSRLSLDVSNIRLGAVNRKRKKEEKEEKASSHVLRASWVPG